MEWISKEVERESALQEMQAKFTEKLKAVENQIGSQSSTRDYSTIEQSFDARLSTNQETWTKELAQVSANFEAQTEEINKRILDLQEIFQADQIQQNQNQSVVEKNFENELEDFKNVMEARLELLENANKDTEKEYDQGEFQELEERIEPKLAQLE